MAGTFDFNFCGVTCTVDLLDRIFNILAERKRFDKFKVANESIVQIMQILEENQKFPFKNIQCKSNEKSQKWYFEGNKLYSSSQFSKASNLYNKSIAFAPKESLELSFSLSNKSAILLHLKKYKQCLETIEQFMKKKNSIDNVKFKVFLQKIECLNALKSSQIEEFHIEVLDWIKETYPPEIQGEMKKKVERCLNKKVDFKPQDTEVINAIIQEFDYSESNNEIPAASNLVELKYDKQYGRHMVAAENIKPGRTLAKEVAFFSTTYFDSRYSTCWGCTNDVLTCVPCDHCVNAIYCSEKCKNETWERYHEVECALMKKYLDDSSVLKAYLLNAIQLTIKTVTEYESIQHLMDEVENLDNSADLRTKGFSKDGTFLSDSYRSIYSLKSYFDRIGKDFSITDVVIKACLIAGMLATETNLFGKKFNFNWKELYENKEVVFITYLIVRNMGIFHLNAFGNSAEGTSIFASLSLVNHSCYPNAMISEHEGVKYLIAKFKIKKGEQIFVSYVEEFLNKRERSELLNIRYKFSCNCILCQQNLSTPLQYPKLMNLSRKLYFTLIKDVLTVQKQFMKFRNDEDSYLSDVRKVIGLLHLLFDSLERLTNYISGPCLEVMSVYHMVETIYEKVGSKYLSVP